MSFYEDALGKLDQHYGHVRASRFGADLSAAQAAATVLAANAAHSHNVVLAFQQAYNAAGGSPPLVEDGIWGPATQAALFLVTGPAATRIASQAATTITSLPVAAAALNNLRTPATIRAFQLAYNAVNPGAQIAVDGVWGPQTQAALASIGTQAARAAVTPQASANAPSLPTAVPSTPPAAPAPSAGPLGPGLPRGSIPNLNPLAAIAQMPWWAAVLGVGIAGGAIAFAKTSSGKRKRR